MFPAIASRMKPFNIISNLPVDDFFVKQLPECRTETIACFCFLAIEWFDKRHACQSYVPESLSNKFRQIISAYIRVTDQHQQNDASSYTSWCPSVMFVGLQPHLSS